MKKALLIIDAQNDFVTGPLGSEYAKNIVIPNIINLIKQFKYADIYATMDTHHTNYLQTGEGKRLPIEHCIKDTQGWNLVSEIDSLVPMVPHRLVKFSFGVNQTLLFDTFVFYNEIHICGLVTDICVVTNALALRSMFPEKKIVVHENCCGGTSQEMHDAAIKVMKSCQIEIDDWERNSEDA